MQLSGLSRSHFRNCLVICACRHSVFGACIKAGTVSAIERSEDGFVVSASDRMVRAAAVLIASGVADNLPDVPGFGEELITRGRSAKSNAGRIGGFA
jgi:thioredoxin reductase